MPDKYIKIFIFLLLNWFFLHLLYIAIDNNLTTANYRYAEIINQTSAMRQESMQIHEEVLKDESLTYIQAAALSRGFIPNGKSYIYLYEAVHKRKQNNNLLR